jgi:hypothetical protein
MTDITDVVPLPPELSTCGCRFAPTTHATTCAVAIAFDTIPLQDRPEYEIGRRFAAISWDYPLRLSGQVNVEVQLDPIAVILEHAEEYKRFELEPGYEEWEKPIVWLTHQISEQCDIGVWFGGRRLSWDSSFFDQFTEYPRWTRDDTDRLDEALGTRVAVDPNQGTLEV